MNAKISVFVVCVEAIISLLLHNLHDCTFKFTVGGKVPTFNEESGTELPFLKIQVKVEIFGAYIVEMLGCSLKTYFNYNFNGRD